MNGSPTMGASLVPRGGTTEYWPRESKTVGRTARSLCRLCGMKTNGIDKYVFFPLLFSRWSDHPAIQFSGERLRSDRGTQNRSAIFSNGGGEQHMKRFLYQYEKNYWYEKDYRYEKNSSAGQQAA